MNTLSDIPDMHYNGPVEYTVHHAVKVTKHDPHYSRGRIVPDPLDKARDYCGQGLKRYGYDGRRLYGEPKKTKLKPVIKTKLGSSCYLDEKRCLRTAYWTRERIDALPLLSRWTMAEPPGAREDWIAWAVDRVIVLGLTYERLYEQAKVQKANGIYSKDIERLNLLLERLAPGKSVSTVLSR